MAHERHMGTVLVIGNDEDETDENPTKAPTPSVNARPLPPTRVDAVIVETSKRRIANGYNPEHAPPRPPSRNT